jgi:hypothetical protein
MDFNGRTDAIESVDIRARVTGYLGKFSFQEGIEVKNSLNNFAARERCRNAPRGIPGLGKIRLSSLHGTPRRAFSTA